jgi:hypothetical protein
MILDKWNYVHKCDGSVRIRTFLYYLAEAQGRRFAQRREDAKEIKLLGNGTIFKRDNTLIEKKDG